MTSQKGNPYKLRVPDEVAETIKGMHPQLKRKVKAALENIISDPFTGKALREELKGMRSYRVGRFRIVYRVASSRIIEIIAVGPRKIIYEETYFTL